MIERIAKLGLKREPGYLYFVGDGKVYRTRMMPTSERKKLGLPDRGPGPENVVVDLKLTQDPDYDYFIDRNGDVCRTKRQGPPLVHPIKIEPSAAQTEPALQSPDRRLSAGRAQHAGHVVTRGDRMTTQEIGKKYVELCREGRREEVLTSLFSNDVVSVEAAAPPGGERTARGLDALRAKSKWWAENHEIHKAEMSDAYPHDDRFAVRFVFDVTHKPSGQRRSIDEVGLFTVVGGRITREEFFYPTA